MISRLEPEFRRHKTSVVKLGHRRHRGLFQHLYTAGHKNSRPRHWPERKPTYQSRPIIALAWSYGKQSEVTANNVMPGAMDPKMLQEAQVKSENPHRMFITCG